jgi:hypothetical protein
MHRTVASFALAAAALAALPEYARADSEEEEDESAPAPEYDRSKVIAVDGAAVVPVGDWSDGAGIGIGALARLTIPMTPKIAITARAGLIYHLAKDFMGSDSQTTEVPLLGGVRYLFSEKLYGAAELGLVYLRASISSDGGGSMTGSDTKLGFSAAAGYRTGKLDLRAGLYFPDTDVMGIFATVGWDVTSL